MTIGEKIYGLRKKLGISQEELAQRVDVSRQAISKWERDEAIPDTDKIVVLSSVFSISTDYLLLDQAQEADIDEKSMPPFSLSKKWKGVLGGIMVGVGILMGLTSTAVIFAWRYLMSSSETPPADMQPVLNIMRIMIICAPIAAVIVLVIGILLLISHRKKCQQNNFPTKRRPIK